MSDDIKFEGLHRYFKSIEKPFEETRSVEEREEAGGTFKGTSIGVFVFSLVPLIPYGLRVVTRRFWAGAVLELWSLKFPLDSFWFWWPVCFTFALLSLILAFTLFKPPKDQLARCLSPTQMRFAYCFGAVEEIRKYQTNKFVSHLDLATKYLRELRRLLSPIFSPFFIPLYRYGQSVDDGSISLEDIRPSQRSSLRLDLSGGRRRWFKLDPQTENILEAFSTFYSIFVDRLKDKKDLTSLAEALSDLATYLYTEIPEISDGSTEERVSLEKLGDSGLNGFANKVKALPPYHPEPTPISPHESVSRKVRAARWKISGLFTHENVLLCFLAWYSLSLILIVSGFAIAFRYIHSLVLDTIIVSTVVGGPVAGAITAVTIAKLRHSENSKDKA